MNTNISGLLKDLIHAFLGVIKALCNLAPAVILAGLFLISILVWLSLQLSDKLMAIIIFIVFAVSVLIYKSTGDSGEASLALVAGLLAAFTVEWTRHLVAQFSITWFIFYMIIALIQSVKLAAEAEDIYRQAAISIDSSRVKEIEKQFKEITKSNTLRMLGPIEEAKVILILSFHKLPLELMGYALKSIEMLTTVTKLDYETITLFHSDLYKMIGLVSETEYHLKIEQIFKILRDTPTSPEEFFGAFKQTRRLAISGDIKVDQYFKLLQNGLERGYAPDDIYEYMIDKQNVT